MIKIIAECGNNAEGDLKLAYKMIDTAKECGCDLVKFQAGKAEDMCQDKSKLDFYKKCQLPIEEFVRLHEYAQKIGIDCFFSLWSEHYIKLLTIEKYHKIPARHFVERDFKWDLHNTFVSIPSDIDYKKYSLPNSIPLYCVTQYPAKEINWNHFWQFKQHFGRCGFSDHFIGVDVAKVAIILGAQVIEKHFTLNHNQSSFRDHIHSAEPLEMKELVGYARDHERWWEEFNAMRKEATQTTWKT